MAKTYETGNVKNIANFQRLIEACKQTGSRYNPSAPELSIGSLEAQYAKVEAAMQQTITAYAVLSQQTARRTTLFKEMKRLATRVTNHIGSIKADPGTYVQAKAILRKIRGLRAGKKPDTAETAEGNTPHKSISVAQTSHDSLVEHFSNLIVLVRKQPQYKPNEKDLTIQQLGAFLQTLNDSNKAVIGATTDISNARNLRNRLLYHQETGIIATVHRIKKYFRTLYTVSSQEYHSIARITFRSKKLNAL